MQVATEFPAMILALASGLRTLKGLIYTEPVVNLS